MTELQNNLNHIGGVVKTDRKNTMKDNKTCIDEIKTFLEENSSNWLTVLIDFSYSVITIYKDSRGLNPSVDLGEDYEEWMTEDLYTYAEFQGDELLDLLNDGCTIKIV